MTSIGLLLASHRTHFSQSTNLVLSLNIGKNPSVTETKNLPSALITYEVVTQHKVLFFICFIYIFYIIFCLFFGGEGEALFVAFVRIAKVDLKWVHPCRTSFRFSVVAAF